MRRQTAQQVAQASAHRIAQCVDLGAEVWCKWDAGAEVYELFTCPNGRECIGCADTLAEAHQIARDYLHELMG